MCDEMTKYIARTLFHFYLFFFNQKDFCVSSLVKHQATTSRHETNDTLSLFVVMYERFTIHAKAATCAKET